MSNDFKLDVGQANELKGAFGKNGWTNSEIKNLCKGSILAEVKEFLAKGGRKSLRSIDDQSARVIKRVTKHEEEHDQQFDPVFLNFLDSGGEKFKDCGSLKNDLKRVMESCLSNHQLVVIRSLFGIDCPELEIDEIARDLGLSKSEIADILHSGLKKLRKPKRKELLKQHLG